MTLPPVLEYYNTRKGVYKIMKIKKLLLSVCMICLALLVLAGATVPAMQFRAQAMAVRATSDNNIYLQPKELFNGKGNYTVDLEYLKNAIQN